MMGDQLATRRSDGNMYYHLAGTQALFEIKPATVWLLPPYDEYIMGYKNRDAIMQFRKSTGSLPKGFFGSMIIYKGQIAGTWRRKVSEKKIGLEYHFFKITRR
jgi:hypothetical protein